METIHETLISDVNDLMDMTLEDLTTAGMTGMVGLLDKIEANLLSARSMVTPATAPA